MSKTARTPRERGIGVKGKGSEMGDRIQRTAAISAIRTRLIVEQIVSFWNIIPPLYSSYGAGPGGTQII